MSCPSEIDHNKTKTLSQLEPYTRYNCSATIKYSNNTIFKPLDKIVNIDCGELINIDSLYSERSILSASSDHHDSSAWHNVWYYLQQRLAWQVRSQRYQMSPLRSAPHSQPLARNVKTSLLRISRTTAVSLPDHLDHPNHACIWTTRASAVC